MIEGGKRPKLSLAALGAVALGGGLQTLSWPRAGLWPLCLVCLTPLILAAAGQRGGRAFFLGWVHGLALTLTSTAWLAEVLSGYGGLGPLPGWGLFVALAAFLALYHGLFAWLICRRGRNTALWMLSGALTFCGLDWLQNWVFTGFNWTPLAGPLVLCLPLAQSADLVGIYGLGFFVALLNFLLAEALRTVRHGFRQRGLPALLTALGLLAVGLAYGQTRGPLWEAAAREAPSRAVAVIQPSVAQDQKWNADFRDRILNRYSALVEEAQAARPWLILWPETAIPFIYGLDQHESRWLEHLGRGYDLPMLVGLAAVSYESAGIQLRNRAWLFQGGRPLEYYDKEHLVPFGEYLPLNWLPFLKWAFMQGLIGAAGAYSPGEPRPPLAVDDQALGLLICFESTFPHLARQRARDGASLLVVTTNDGWFGRSGAPVQHLYQAALRAIETRRPVLRAGNNGISAVIGPSGRILARSRQDEVKTFFFEAPVLPPERLADTFFVRYGWALAPVSAVLAVLALAWSFWARRW